MGEDIHRYEFIIIGAGLAGATLFASLSTIAPTLLIEKKNSLAEFRAARILTKHSHQFISTDMDGWVSDPKINLRPCNAVCYSSRNQDAPIYGTKEFGQDFGYVIDEHEYIKWHIARGLSNNGKILWNCEVLNIGDSHVDSSHSTKKVREISAQILSTNISPVCFSSHLVIIATGSSNSSFFHQIGLSIPSELNMLSATFYATHEVINSNFEWDYYFHLHPKISTKGPLNINRGLDFFNINYVADKTYEEMEEILNRVLLNYKPIQKFFKDIKNPPQHNRSEKFRRLKVWKHPANFIVGANIISVGEATGMVTDCYYEGSLAILASVNIAVKTLLALYKSGDDFSLQKLKSYDINLRKTILGDFEKSQRASQDMFLSEDKNQPQLWDAYLTAINKYKKVRENIHFAWTNDDIANYPLEHDEYCGEKIYLSLPLSLRMLLTPLFLKLKFTS